MVVPVTISYLTNAEPAMARNSSSKQLNLLSGLLIAAVITHALLNILAPHAFGVGNTWKYEATVPAGTPMGDDLKGFLDASKTIFAGKNPFGVKEYVSPPFTAVVFFPLTLFSVETAYVIQFACLLAFNIGSIALLASLARRALLADGEIAGADADAIIRPIFFAVVILQIYGYPFEFALERGNYDTFALISILLGLNFTLGPRWNLWLPVMFFSLAAHLKVYPVIFLLVPLWQNRWRAVVPCIVVNFLMLFSFGFNRAIEFLTALHHISMNPYIWHGNSSATCFIKQLLEPKLRGYLSTSLVHPTAILFAIGIPLWLWLHGTIRLMRAGFGTWPVLLWAGLTTPIMCILPSVSHDYKLVIIVLPAFICLVWFALRFVHHGELLPVLGVVGTLGAMVLIDRSTMYSWGSMISNDPWNRIKYPFVILSELCAYVAVLGYRPAIHRASMQDSHPTIMTLDEKRKQNS
jgi:hypothetical protein